MNKKKAIVCTIIFTIIIFSVVIVLMCLKPYGSKESLFHIFCHFIVGDWIGKHIVDFYDWLRYGN